MDISGLFMGCAGKKSAGAAPNSIKQAPVAISLKGAGNSCTSKSSLNIEPAFSRVSRVCSSVRRVVLPLGSWERNQFKRVQQKTEVWVRQLPVEERYNLLINQCTYWVHAFVDSNMLCVKERGGVERDFKRFIVDVVRKQGGMEKVAYVGGPGLLTQQLKIMCGRAGLEVSNKNPALEQACDYAAREIGTKLAGELGTCSYMDLRYALSEAIRDYLADMKARAAGLPSHDFNSVSRRHLYHTDSIKLSGRWCSTR
ncbi:MULTISPECIES: hypothetical protein [Pseudomonas]|uniref:hypothetical protein n=1 Tax=Pseudomonas TaxID=286 RepID=UPI00117B745A|nr:MULTISPECIES: hypothetical protein [Pseudomonas]